MLFFFIEVVGDFWIFMWLNNLEVKMLKLKLCLLFILLFELVLFVFVGIFMLLSVVWVNEGFKLCKVIWCFFLFLWEMVMLGICWIDLVIFKFGNLLMFCVIIDFLLLIDVCFFISDLLSDLWKFDILMIFIFCVLVLLVCLFVVFCVWRCVFDNVSVIRIVSCFFFGNIVVFLVFIFIRDVYIDKRWRCFWNVCELFKFI